MVIKNLCSPVVNLFFSHNDMFSFIAFLLEKLGPTVSQNFLLSIMFLMFVMYFNLAFSYKFYTVVSLFIMCFSAKCSFSLRNLILSLLTIIALCISFTAQKMKFSIKDFFSKCDQIRRKMRIWSHLLKKSLIENFIFCAVFIHKCSLICQYHLFIKWCLRR